MLKYVVAYLGAGLTFAAIDAVWLTTMADRLYRPVIGPLMADKPNMTAAVIFYLISIGGIVFLAIVPALKEAAWTRAFLNGAVLGFVAYATYDLTNQATLSVWSTRLTIIDLCWGTTLTAVASVGGYFAARWAEGRFG
ncbi:DUF2177 family protein [Brevundimonas sp. P7753]|uniref:DUF2177 family protein n=1 Tax=Brevundimonas sp. P7753 TaxID=2726982 RepID=UPI0015BD78BE|nr:DUF2177 family protein [Brevundimonas sp. P7753]NWE52511.1 DUF2177 family protein [Brevundimonas sp. P7753]